MNLKTENKLNMLSMQKSFKYGRTTIKYEILDSGCWECVGRKPNKDGYPYVNFKGKSYNVHRFVYIMEKNGGKDLPPNTVIRHICDNPICIYPDHLLSGTQADNVSDMVERKRNKSSYKMLSEDDVKLIRLWYENGFKTQQELAEIFNVSLATISLIINYKTWIHVK